MAVKRSKSRGIRPVRQAWLSGVVMLASVILVVKGVVDMRATGASGSPFLALGLFPALLSPIALVYYLLKIPVVRQLRRGTSAIARWTVSADEFQRFMAADVRVERETRASNFLKTPGTIPANGVEVIFSDDGVLIGDGYFPPVDDRGATRPSRALHRIPSADDRVRDDPRDTCSHVQCDEQGRSDDGNASRARGQ